LRPVAFAPDPVVQKETIVERIVEKAAEPVVEYVAPPVEVTLEMYNNLRATIEQQRVEIDESAHTNEA
jgi:hypothetical protein